MPKRRLVAVLMGAAALLIVIVVLAGRGKIEPGLLSPPVSRVPNAPVDIVRLETVPSARDAIGTIQSRIEVDAASRVSATVKEVTVHAGDPVKVGQVLVRLDDSDLKAAVARANGQLAAARANLERASKDERRFSALLKRGSVTAHEFDAVQANYRASRGDVESARAQVAAAEASLRYAIVRSPVAGVVAERMVEPGDMALPGKPLVRVYDSHALRVELRVPEELTRNISLGMPLTVNVQAAGRTISTKVNEIVPAADPASRTFLVRAPMPSDVGLRPGMFASASFDVGREKILTVARSAIETVGQLETVRVLERGAVRVRQITTGRAFGARVEVLSGLQQGDKVLLKDGEKMAADRSSHG
jgi:RND family efflux transporter MFP subunit